MKELLNEWKKFLNENEGYAYLDSDGDKKVLPQKIIDYYLDTLGKQRLGSYLQYTNDGKPNFYDSYGPFDTVAKMVVRSLEVDKKIDYSQLGATYDLESVLVKYAKDNQLHKNPKYDMRKGEGE